MVGPVAGLLAESASGTLTEASLQDSPGRRIFRTLPRGPGTPSDEATISEQVEGFKLAYIHGMVSWADSKANVRSDVKRMMDAVAHYPWKGSRLDEMGQGNPTCVLATQAASESPRFDPDNSGTRPGSGCSHAIIAADIQLHDRSGLRAQLRASGAQRLPQSDAELVLLAVDRWGLGCADRLLGVGVFSVWDASKERLFCWRDTAGARPFYYHYSPTRGLIFSSDLQSMAAHPDVAHRFDLPYLRSALEIRNFQHPSRTFLQGVRKLPSGHCLTVDKAGLRVSRYWRPLDLAERRYGDENEYVDELRELLQRAVLCRLPNAVGGVGAHLTGGLDSSSVAVVAGRKLHAADRQLIGFSWAPPRDVVPPIAHDERPLAEAAAHAGRVALRFTRLEPRHIVEDACRDLGLHPATTLTVELAASSDAAAAGVNTLLSGWGGDESVVFNGRGYFADLARRGRWFTIQHELRLRSDIHEGPLFQAWRGRVVYPLLPNRLAHRLRPSERAMLPPELRPEFARQLAQVEALPRRDLRERPGVHRMQLMLLTSGHLQYRMESWAAHGATLGITYAFPLLDQRLVEFALSIPDRLYFKHGWKRWLYRTAMAGVLPDDVRWNPYKKDVAMVAQVRRVREQARNYYRDQLRSKRDNPLVDTDQILAGTQLRTDQSASPDNPAPQDRPVGSAAWLAFTELSAS